jgi:hypothetical protein
MLLADDSAAQIADSKNRQISLHIPRASPARGNVDRRPCAGTPLRSSRNEADAGEVVIKATAADGLIRDELVHFLSASGGEMRSGEIARPTRRLVVYVVAADQCPHPPCVCRNPHPFYLADRTA